MCWASPRPVTTMQIKLLNESKHIVNMHRIARGLSYAYRSSGKYMSSLCFKMVLELRLTRERKLTKKTGFMAHPCVAAFKRAVRLCFEAHVCFISLEKHAKKIDTEISAVRSGPVAQKSSRHTDVIASRTSGGTNVYAVIVD